MLQQQVYIINTVLMALDAACVIVAGYGAFYLRRHLSEFLWGMDTTVFLASVLTVMFVNNFVMGQLRLYGERRQRSVAGILWGVSRAVALDFAVLAAAVYLFNQEDYSRLFMGLFASLTFVLIALERILAQFYLSRLSRKGLHLRRILVVGVPERARFVRRILDQQLSLGHQVVGCKVPAEGTLVQDMEPPAEKKEFEQALKAGAIDEVVFALDGDRRIELGPYIRICRTMGLQCLILPAMWNAQDGHLTIERWQGVPFLTFQSGSINATGLLYKRLLDIAGGTVGCLLLLLMYPAVALAIRLDSPGPVFFRQKRMGQNGRIFTLYKFRTMVADAEARKAELAAANEMGGAIFKVACDPRITGVGRWLRKTSLDEFPQFINVLKGEMSLVGTRPPTLDEVSQYRLEHLRRISAKPGITGLWQVSGRNKITDFDRIVELDCRYLDNWRFLDDLVILFKTVIVVLQRKGAV